MSPDPGIYVEILIHDALEHVWALTQTPEVHQRWDLRFTRIHYLPRPDLTKPQQFLYETRIGFGLSIKGTGESVGTRTSSKGDATSSLKFASGRSEVSDPRRFRLLALCAQTDRSSFLHLV